MASDSLHPIAIVSERPLYLSLLLPHYFKVGIAAQLPSGVWAETNLDYDTFFDFLLEKGQAYGPIPMSRFNIQGYVT